MRFDLTSHYYHSRHKKIALGGLFIAVTTPHTGELQNISNALTRSVGQTDQFFASSHAVEPIPWCSGDFSDRAGDSWEHAVIFPVAGITDFIQITDKLQAEGFSWEPVVELALGGSKSFCRVDSAYVFSRFGGEGYPQPAQPLSKIESIRMFFRDPAISLVYPSHQSTLCLLRRDMLLMNDNDVQPFAKIVLTFIALDLLASMLAGDTKPGQSKKRFIDFSVRYMFHDYPSPEEVANLIYMFRCSAVHAYSIVSDGGKEQHTFQLVTGSSTDCLETNWSNKSLHYIYVEGFLKRFERSLEQYRYDALHDKASFSVSKFDEVGLLHIGPDVL